MWDNPTALSLVSRLIFLATAGYALFMGGRYLAEEYLPFRHVEVTGAAHPETAKAIPGIVHRLQGSFFSLDLQGARTVFAALPWVRAASVRRVWPDTLVVELEEHVPAAAWNDLAVMNVHGEVFPARPWPELPRISAPEGTEKEVSRRYGEFARILEPHGWRIRALHLDGRHAWGLALQDGPYLELGRDRQGERLRRFLTFYPLAAGATPGIRRVDMRYPNGFAVQAAEGNT